MIGTGARRGNERKWKSKKRDTLQINLNASPCAAGAGAGPAEPPGWPVRLAPLDQAAAWMASATTLGWGEAVGSRRRLAMFGGQGAPGGQLKELRTVVAGSAAVRGFVAAVAAALDGEAAAVCALSSERVTRAGRSEGARPFEHGFDVLRWAQGGPADGVPLAYLNSAPVSMPLTLVIQLATYLYCWERSGNGLADGCSSGNAAFVHGATGHSQGLAAAMVVGLGCCTLDRFQAEAIRFAKVLLHFGTHAAAAILPAPLSPPGESWMLAVLKLPRADLERAVAAHNADLSACEAAAAGAAAAGEPVPAADGGSSGHDKRSGSEAGGGLGGGFLDIAVCNGPEAHVVAGHPAALASLARCL